VGGAHYGYNIICGSLFVGIDDYSGFSILRLGYGLGNEGFQGVDHDCMCAYEKFLFFIDGHYHGLLGLCIALGFRDTELHDIGIGQRGDDQEEQEQNE